MPFDIPETDHLVVSHEFRPYRWPNTRVPRYSLELFTRTRGDVRDPAARLEPHSPTHMRRIADRVAQDVNWSFDPAFAGAERLVHRSGVYFAAPHRAAPHRVVQVYYDLWQRSWAAHEHTMEPGAADGLGDRGRWTLPAGDDRLPTRMRPTAALVFDDLDGLPVDALLSAFTSELTLGRTPHGDLVHRPPTVVPAEATSLLREKIEPDVLHALGRTRVSTQPEALIRPHALLRKRIAEFDGNLQKDRTLHDLAVDVAWRTQAAALSDRLEQRMLPTINALRRAVPGYHSSGPKPFPPAAPNPFTIRASTPIADLVEHPVNERELARDAQRWSESTTQEPGLRSSLQDIGERVREDLALRFDPRFRAIREIAYHSSVYLHPDNSDEVIRVFYNYFEPDDHGWSAESIDWNGQSGAWWNTEVRRDDLGPVYHDLPQRISIDDLAAFLSEDAVTDVDNSFVHDAIQVLRDRDAAMPTRLKAIDIANQPAVILAARQTVERSLADLRRTPLEVRHATRRDTRVSDLEIETHRSLIARLDERLAAVLGTAPAITSIHDPRAELRAESESVARDASTGMPPGRHAGIDTAALITVAGTGPRSPAPGTVDPDPPPHFAAATDTAHELE